MNAVPERIRRSRPERTTRRLTRLLRAARKLAAYRIVRRLVARGAVYALRHWPLRFLGPVGILIGIGLALMGRRRRRAADAPQFVTTPVTRAPAHAPGHDPVVAAPASETTPTT
ncbi:MAG: hypothetical protein LC713_01210 [Actinobacteria bacterium]|nr:hypothetical protein [Actinomycetota bacterium]